MAKKLMLGKNSLYWWTYITLTCVGLPLLVVLLGISIWALATKVRC